MILRTERGMDGLWSVAQQIDTPRLPGGGTDGLFAWAVANADNLFAVSTGGLSLGGLGSARIFRRNLEGQGLLDPLAGPLGRVVGAEREDSGAADNEGDNSAEDAGAAYVFERMGGTWEQTQYLKASNVAAGFFFGATLTMSDTTLVVGSPGESSIGGEDSGAVYIFDNSEGQ